MDEITGLVERITYQNEENGYTVLQLKKPGMRDTLTVVGSMAGVKPGETLTLQGNWVVHPHHGRQFEVTDFRSERPSDIQGIKKYLSSGLIPGIGPKYAERIVETFGTETLQIIDETPERLHEVEGIGKKRAEKIASSWSGQKTIREVMIFLQTHSITPALAQKIYKKYGDRSIEEVTKNPYNLSRELSGVGFKTADTIAQKLGIAPDSEVRIRAAIESLLMEVADEGHVCLPEEELFKRAKERLGFESIEPTVEKMALEGVIEKTSLLHEGVLSPFVWGKPLYLSEAGIARELHRIQKAPSPLRSIKPEAAVSWAEEKLKIQLAEQQKKAVMRAFSEKILIITGGPGTGKSTIINAILKIAEKLTSRILLAAPTGRAAKRMTEITQRQAKTIHSLLEVNFRGGGFKRGRDNPLEGDLLIVDESSMIDTWLMYQLLKACPSTMCILFVGDIYQLPSVGPGNVLKDILETKAFASVSLNQIFRQAEGSRIVVNAHRINAGDMPDISNPEHSDFFFVEEENAEKMASQILGLVAIRIPKKFGFNPKNEIQVLSPMRKGIVGIEHLNMLLQKKINPKDQYIERYGSRFSVGDKVMQIRNNYNKEVFNGDIGFILAIDPEDQAVVIQFEEKEVVYEFSELDEIRLAWCVSIHKYQGSEVKAVVIPLDMAHSILLTRNLLYTGVTRGKRLVILVGNKKALYRAVMNDEVKKRYTGLQTFILGQAHFRSGISI